MSSEHNQTFTLQHGSEPAPSAGLGGSACDAVPLLQDQLAPAQCIAASSSVPAMVVQPSQDSVAMVMDVTLGDTHGLHAAKDAAEFVQRLFSDVEATSDEALQRAASGAQDGVRIEPVTDVLVDQGAGLALPITRQPVAQHWPLDGAGPMQGQHVLVLGLGASGLAMARWCARCGAQVTVADTRAQPPQLEALMQSVPQARFVAGAMDAQLLVADGSQTVHRVLRSPGLSPQIIAPILEAAKRMGISDDGELSAYFEALDVLRSVYGYAPAVLAITGTNGKTTVTSLTGKLVGRAGKTVAIAGNIGPTLLDTLSAHIDSASLPEVWVLELSSFQLDGVTNCEPHAGVVLNVTQDHLDWHGCMADYTAAKARIFGQAGLMVLNRDDANVMAMLPEPVRIKLQKPYERPYITFGGGMPQRPGDFGIEMVNSMAWLVRAAQADETRKRTKKIDATEDLHIQRLMPADALRIRGRHNACNALAALALAASAGCTLGPMLYGLREYAGEPHRVEPVAIVHDVEYFDDSKGTNVGATVAALTGLGADRKLVLIAGGDGKGQDFAPLLDPVSRYVRAVVLIGRDAPLLQAALQAADVPLLNAVDMPAAVQMASQRAHAGDAVLLSPACASFDMFSGYEHRAQVFVQAVHALAQAAGQTMEGWL